MKKAFVSDGYCGLYCGACPVFLATKSGEAEKTGTDKCMGCKSETVSAGWCRECSLKKCARKKGFDFCYECADYPCQDLEGFKNAPEWPYHTEVYDYMGIIKKEGKEGWLKKMSVRWSCPSCGKEASWWDLECLYCGTKLNGYKKP